MAPPERAAAQVKVQVGEVAAIAYGAVFRRLGLVLELAWLPLLVMLAANLAPGLIQSLATAPADATIPYLIVATLVRVLAALLCLNAFAVRWYQTLLFSNGRAFPRRLFVAAWLRFIGYTLLFSVPAAGPAAALVIYGASPAADDATRTIVAAAGLLSIAAALGMLRLSLIWPAAAQGDPMSWREAWRRMRGNTWRLIAATFLVYAPILVTVLFVLVGILAAAHVDMDQLSSHPPVGLVLLHGVLDTVLGFIFVALGATVLAEFHRRIVRNAPADRSGDQ